MSVLLSIFTALSLGTMGHAEVVCTDQYKDLLQYDRRHPRVRDDDADRNKLKDQVEECEKKRSKSMDDCKGVKDDFNQIVKDVQNSCEKFDLKSSEDPGSIACSSKLDQCACLDKTTRAIEKAQGMCRGVTEKTHPFCGQNSDAKADRLQKKIENAEKEVKEAKAEVNRLEGEADKNENNAEDKAREAKTALRKAEADHTQAVNEANSQLSQAQRQMYADMNQLQDKIYNAEQSVTDTYLKDSAAYKDYLDQDLKITMGCTTQATQAVAAMQAEANAAVKTGTYLRGDQTNLFRQVGQTDRKAWQDKVKIRKQWCLDDETTHASRKSNELTYEETKKGNLAARRLAQKQVAALKQQMVQKMSPDGVTCGATAANGAAIQNQQCSDIAEMKRKTATADAALDAAKKEARDQEKAAAAKASKIQPKQDGKIAQAKADLADKEAQLRTYRDQEKVTDQYPNAGDKAEDAKILDTDYLKLTDRAGRMNRCCQIATPGTEPAREEVCARAKGFLTAHNYSTDLQTHSTTQNRPAQTPTQTPPIQQQEQTTTPQSNQ